MSTYFDFKGVITCCNHNLTEKYTRNNVLNLQIGFSHVEQRVYQTVRKIYRHRFTNLGAALSFLALANEVWGKIMFLHLSVILFT